MKAANRILVALDVDTYAEAKRIVDQLQDGVGGYKVGMRLFYREGPQVVPRLAERGGLVFLDLKMHDIPQTVAQATRALISLGADIVNVHASGGLDMMKAAVNAAREEADRTGIRMPRLLAVTVLTSLTAEALNNEIGVCGGTDEVVLRWAQLAWRAGMDGVVCSPREILIIRAALGPDFLIVTPGVRPTGAAKDDQKRIATPREAVRLGADYLVIGRPITGASDPREAVRLIVEDIDNPMV
ncbi:MAG: orotidine-5'-phosphate decarboxylase [Desulforudis sp.]|nr:MAG: orotidine-5'-phosphate decarboxylase [Desulforudis sp.]